MKKIRPEFEFSDEQLNLIPSLAAQTSLLPETVKILYGRGVDTVEKIQNFINPSKKNFISPFKMSGMQDAVELIKRAKDEGWSVAVFGDYDADGVCASTVMYYALKEFGIDAEVFIPERKDGYGLSVAAVDAIFEQCFPQLVITVDCGISCATQVEYIKEQGAEVIVTDHHELPDKIPECVCINPKFDDGYIYDNLCGAGVALKVGVALNGESFYGYADFAAIATVADSVTLTGENRDLVYEGLELINSRPRKCYSYFFDKLDGKITSQNLAFTVAPKINAAGRMGDAHSAFELFTSQDENKIFSLAAKLTALNAERQKKCDELYASAKSKIKKKGAGGKIIMLWDDDWNAGFTGIVAARIADEYARPAILFVRNGNMLKGSARSVESVNIFSALKACEDCICEFGGHSQAAGINIDIADFDLLENKLNSYLSENYGPEDFEPSVTVSGGFSQRNLQRFIKELELLEPYGVGNRRPLFEFKCNEVDFRFLKPESPHLNLNYGNFEFMYFGGGKYAYMLQSAASKRIVFEYNVSRYKGKDYQKGYVKNVISNDVSAAECVEEQRINDILVLARPVVNCKINYCGKDEADGLMLSGDGGTVFIASEYGVLKSYKNAEKLPAELFCATNVNVSGTVLISPAYDYDFSDFDRVVFLDEPVNGVRYSGLAGKEVIICSTVKGYNFLKELSCERQELVQVYTRISSNAAGIIGGDSAFVALKNDFNLPKLQVAFAVEVFRQLSIISFEGGRLTVNRGVKSELTNSELYNTVKKITL